MADQSRRTRLQVMLWREELQAVESWRAGRRMRRSAAVRALLRRGLAAEGFALADPDAKSASFGVMDDETPA
jgi:hypothetical protein